MGQDVPNGYMYSKGFTIDRDENSENEQLSRHTAHTAYLIMKRRPGSKQQFDSPHLPGAHWAKGGMWTVLFISLQYDKPGRMYTYWLPLCTSRTRGALPPAFAQDWTPVTAW